MTTVFNIADYPVQQIDRELIQQSDMKIREFKDQDPKSEALRVSMKTKGQLQPAILRAIDGRPEFQLIDGLHRNHCAGLNKWTHLACIVLPHETTDDECRAIQFSLNYARVNQTRKEEAAFVNNWMMHNPTATIAMSAEQFGVSVTTIQNYLSLRKLSEKAQKALDNEEINISAAVAIARIKTEEGQDAILNATTDSGIKYSDLPIAEFTELCRKMNKSLKSGTTDLPTGPIYRRRPAKDCEQHMQSMHNDLQNMDKDNPDWQFLAGRVREAEWVGQMDQESIDAKEQVKATNALETAQKTNTVLKETLAEQEKKMAALQTQLQGLT